MNHGGASPGGPGLRSTMRPLVSLCKATVLDAFTFGRQVSRPTWRDGAASGLHARLGLLRSPYTRCSDWRSSRQESRRYEVRLRYRLLASRVLTLRTPTVLLGTAVPTGVGTLRGGRPSLRATRSALDMPRSVVTPVTTNCCHGSDRATLHYMR